MSEKMNPQPNDWREARRLRAWELKQKGWKPKAIAEALGVTAGAVSQWLKRGEAAGPAALRSRRGGGPKPRLNGEQLAELRAHLSKGAEPFGFRGEGWTQPRVAALIKRSFGVSYPSAHGGRSLKKLGWSGQKPVTRASQRNEAVIERWRTEQGLELEKKPSRRDAP
jgi:transposase